MVPSRSVKSEYMKRFKEPKWEACGPCYQELLRYRLSRRLLEQAHRPWFWDGWEQDSSLSSGSAGSSPPPGTSSPEAARRPREEEAAAIVAPGKAEAPGEPGLDRIGAPEEAGTDSPGGPLRGSDEEDQEKAEADQGERKLAVKALDKSMSQAQRLASNRGVLGGRSDRRRLKSPQRTGATKEIRHPFALYGWGEKQTDTGSQKTHNVCASASENEIHESALRAKNRRQMEKKKLSQRQVHPIEVERTWRTKPSGPDNPWMTEYMRCYSARAR